MTDKVDANEFARKLVEMMPDMVKCPQICEECALNVEGDERDECVWWYVEQVKKNVEK